MTVETKGEEFRPATRAEALKIATAPGQPHEVRTIPIHGVPQRVFVNAPATLGQLYDDNVSDRTFLVYDDERYTFRETHAKAARIARLLVERFGVVKGDRVAISMRNFPEWIMAFEAATSIGAIAVAMNALWQPDELAYGLADSGAKVLLADAERLDRLARIEPAPDTAVIAVRAKATHPDTPNHLEDLLADVPEGPFPAADVLPEDPATIFYTSGSTGHPKGVVSSHRNIVTALFSWELDGRAGMLLLGVTPPEPAEQPGTLLAVPLFHATGSHAVYLASYRSQRKIVCMYKWDPELAAELIERERLTMVTAPAAMTGDLVRVARETQRDLSSLVTVGGGGAPRAPEQVKQIGSSFTKALPNTGWGMTETNAIGTGIGGQDYLDRPASSGRCSYVLDLKVIDEAGNELPSGERGELLVRGTSVFRGYWNRPEVNRELFLEGGWFRTGDVAYLDDEGYLFIVDRIKDLIIRGGENIGCGQVEAAILTHPLAREAAVYGVPDERLGEEVGATVYAAPGLEAAELQSYLRQHLAAFEVPRFVRIVGEPLPRTASGKVLKRELREEAAKDLGR
jgi:long-chain acyl-CoA synthetase